MPYLLIVGRGLHDPRWQVLVALLCGFSFSFIFTYHFLLLPCDDQVEFASARSLVALRGPVGELSCCVFARRSPASLRACGSLPIACFYVILLLRMCGYNLPSIPVETHLIMLQMFTDVTVKAEAG